MRYYAANLKSVVEKKKWHHSKVYSLSQRYQVEENIIVARVRVNSPSTYQLCFQLIRRICVITFVFITVCALVYVPLLVLRSGVIEWFATAAIDIGVAMSVNILVELRSTIWLLLFKVCKRFGARHLNRNSGVSASRKDAIPAK